MLTALHLRSATREGGPGFESASAAASAVLSVASTEAAFERRALLEIDIYVSLSACRKKSMCASVRVAAAS